MPKIQERPSKSARQAYVTIPKEHMDVLGWKKGDVVVASSNPKSDEIVFHRVVRNDEN